MAMTDKEFEDMIARVMKTDFVPRDGFKEELLARCLSVLNEGIEGEEAFAAIDCRELEDHELEMLAAAGEPVMYTKGTLGSPRL